MSSWNYDRRSSSGDGAGWAWAVLLVLVLILWGCYEGGRENACTRNGWTPVYAGKYGTVRQCTRIVNGESQVADPADLP